MNTVNKIAKAVHGPLNAVLTAVYWIYDRVTGSCPQCGQRQKVHKVGCDRIVSRRPETNATNTVSVSRNTVTYHAKSGQL